MIDSLSGVTREREEGKERGRQADRQDILVIHINTGNTILFVSEDRNRQGQQVRARGNSSVAKSG